MSWGIEVTATNFRGAVTMFVRAVLDDVMKLSQHGFAMGDSVNQGA